MYAQEMTQAEALPKGADETASMAWAPPVWTRS
jgi:hypothetical protein